MATNGTRPAGDDRYDVIIVGARCAGSSLAVMLARAGLRVAVVEQARFPRPTLSSHLMEADALLFLGRLGVLDAVRRTGVRFMKQVDVRINDFHHAGRFPLYFDDLGGAAFLQRHLLDAILADQAAASGAHMRMGTKVVEVLWERQRVCGVRVEHDGTESELRAPLVVGADGRASTIAYMCGARKYNIYPNERSYYFTFFEGADPAFDDLFVFHRWGDRMVWAGAADSGLYLVGVSPERHEREYFRDNTEAGLLAHMRSCAPTAEALANARIATKISGIRKFEGYFRQATGPGWVLVGDSGHFKDPSAGRGIGDAFTQVDHLAPVIVSGLSGPARELDLSLRRWWEWRDRSFQGYYWLATVLGKVGTFPRMIPEAMRRLHERGELDRFYHLFSHRTRFEEVFPLNQISLATARLLRSGRVDRAELLRDAGKMMVWEPRRRWTNRFPALAASETTAAPPVRPARTAPNAAAEATPDTANGAANAAPNGAASKLPAATRTDAS